MVIKPILKAFLKHRFKPTFPSIFFEGNLIYLDSSSFGLQVLRIFSLWEFLCIQCILFSGLPGRICFLWSVLAWGLCLSHRLCPAAAEEQVGISCKGREELLPLGFTLHFLEVQLLNYFMPFRSCLLLQNRKLISTCLSWSVTFSSGRKPKVWNGCF